MNPLISTIIPVYNTEHYLEKCVDSVVNQTYKNLQIILVDDGSTDNSPALCEKYAQNDSRIVVIHKKNGGLSSARNAGLQVSTGDYITFVDSDDYISFSSYQEMISAIRGRDNVVACSCFRRVDENGNVYERNDPHNAPEETSNLDYLKELLLHIGDVSVCTKLFPRNLIKDKRFDESRLNEDLLFEMEIIPSIDKIVYTGQVGYYYLSRNDSISSSYGKAIEDMAPNSILVNSIVQSDYPQFKEESYRFALFQNMNYLLLVPKELRTKDNENYKRALRYIRTNFLKFGISNNYLDKKSKLIIAGLILCPEPIIRLFQRKY